MPGAAPSEGTPQNDQSYADAFAAAAASGDDLAPAGNPTPTEESDAPAVPASDIPASGEGASAPTEPVAAPAAGDAGVPEADGKTPAPTEPAAEPAPVAAPAEAAPAPASADDIVKGLADLLKNQPAPADPAALAAAEPEQAPLYSQDEISTLSEYEKNWPDVAVAESLKRRAEYHDLMKFVFSEVAEYTRPLFEQLRAVGNTLHIGELKQAVPDYSDSLEADVANWIGSQPTYLQGAMKQVMQQGTSDEVADLIGRYRAATGTVPAPAAPAASAPAAPAKPAITELSSAAKQAAESLAPVSGDRSQVPQGEDPQDFVTAFARYAAETMSK